MTHPLSILYLYISSIYHVLLVLARALRSRIRILSGCNSHVEVPRVDPAPLWPPTADQARQKQDASEEDLRGNGMDQHTSLMK